MQLYLFCRQVPAELAAACKLARSSRVQSVNSSVSAGPVALFFSFEPRGWRDGTSAPHQLALRQAATDDLRDVPVNPWRKSFEVIITSKTTSMTWRITWINIEHYENYENIREHTRTTNFKELVVSSRPCITKVSAFKDGNSRVFQLNTFSVSERSPARR